jgi:hypothetical protein
MLKLGRNFELPLSAVTQKVNILGMSGSGKSNCSGRAVEQMLEAKAQVVLFDPKNEAWGLRLAADGKKPGFQIPVFGGPNGDVPLKPDMGARIAELIVRQDYSAIIDTSGFDEEETAIFCTAWADRFRQLKLKHPGAMTLILEEAETYIPENPMSKLDQKMLKAFMKVQKLLRSKGVGFWTVGQRTQEVSKAVLNQAETYILFRLGGTQEREVIKNLIGRKDKEFIATIDAELPALETGTALVWSPWYLKVREHFKILKKTTFDAGATPEVGARRVEARALSPIDLQHVTEAMADVIEEAEKNDPVKLQGDLNRYKRELEAANKRYEALEARPAPTPVAIPKTREVPAFKDAQLARIEKIVQQITTANEKAGERTEAHVAALEKYRDDYRNGEFQRTEQLSRIAAELTAALNGATAAKNIPVPAAVPVKPAVPISRPIAVPPPPSDPGNANAYRDKLGAKQQTILDTILTFEGLGRSSIERSVVAAFVGMTATGGGYKNYLGGLRSGLNGQIPALVDYVGSDCIALTADGRAAATSSVQINSVQDCHEAWKKLIKASKQVQIVEAVITSHPHPVLREQVAAHLDMEVTGGGFKNYLGSLRTLGVIEYCTVKQDVDGTPQDLPALKATDLLYPEGLA